MGKCELGFFKEISEENRARFVYQSFIELALEVLYTFLMPILIRKKTRYKFFYPLVSGKQMFKRYLL